MIELRQFSLSIALSLCAFCVSFYLIYDNTFNLLFLIPLTYGIINILCIRLFCKDIFKEFIMLIIHGMMFLRMVISPLLFSISNNNNLVMINLVNYEKAVILILYEMICIYFILFLYNYFRYEKETNIYMIDVVSYKNKALWAIVIILSLLGFCLLICPNAINLYRTCFDFFTYEFTGFDSRKIINSYSGSTASKFGIVTFRYIFNIARIIVPCMILVLLKNKGVRKQFCIMISIIFVILLNIIIMDDTLAYSVCYSLIVLVFISKVYQDEKVIFVALEIALILTVLFFVFRFMLQSSKYGFYEHRSSTIVYVSGVLQAYFSGIRNIAAGFNIDPTSFFMQMKYFIYEILRGIPYASTIFHLDDTSFGTFFNEANNSMGQIVPTLSASYYYFGWLLAPLLSCVLVGTGLVFNRKTKTETNPLKLVSEITIVLYSVLGISMYSLEITCVGFFSLAMPIYILGYFLEHVKIN